MILIKDPKGVNQNLPVEAGPGFWNPAAKIGDFAQVKQAGIDLFSKGPGFVEIEGSDHPWRQSPSSTRPCIPWL